MTEATLAKIIDWLEAIKNRPQMYVLNSNVEAMSSLLWGFNLGCTINGDEIDWGILRKHQTEVMVERGWHPGARPADYEMKEKGWSDAAILQELLTIEIEAWRRMKTE